MPESSLQKQPLEEEEEMLQSKPILQLQPIEEEEEELMPKLQLQPLEEEEEMLQTKPLLQLQPLEEEEEEDMIQPNWIQKAGCSGCGEKEISKLQTSTQAIQMSPLYHIELCGGQTLPDSNRNFFESRMGYNFSNVRVHTFDSAKQMNQQLGTQAFTYGNNIYFNKGKYSPVSSVSRKLLAHELTHVVQQNGIKNYLSQPLIQREYETGTSPTMAPATPRRFRVGACTTPRRLLNDTTNVASGNDFRYHDFPTLPSLPAWKTALLGLKRRSTDFANLNDMRTELGLHAGSEGFRMVTHFASGTGSRLIHNAASPLGSRARSSADVGRTHSAVRRLLQMQLTAMAASGTIDCSLLNLPSTSVPRPHFTYLGSGPMLKGIVGGVQGLTIEMTRFIITPATRNYFLGMRYIIEDDFGVDATDLYSPGLISFWVLQHERSGYRPFVNQIDLTFFAGGRF